MADIGLAWVNPAPFTKPENVVNFAKNAKPWAATRCGPSIIAGAIKSREFIKTHRTIGDSRP